MDRNTFTGLFLILIILVGSTYLMKPSDQEIKREEYVQDSIKRAQSARPATKPQATAQAPTAPVVDSALLKGPFGGARTGNNQPVILENEHLKVMIGTKGGSIQSVVLKEHETYDQKPVILFTPETSNFGLTFTAGGSTINTSDLFFTSSTSGISVTKADSASITMRLSYSPTQFIDYIYSLKGDSYKVGLTIATSGMQNVLPANGNINLNWSATLTQKEKDFKNF